MAGLAEHSPHRRRPALLDHADLVEPVARIHVAIARRGRFEVRGQAVAVTRFERVPEQGRAQAMALRGWIDARKQ